MSFFLGGGGGHWYPCFGFLVMPPLGFKNQSGFCLIRFFCGGKCNVHSPEIQVWCYICLLPGPPACRHVQKWDLAQNQTGNHPHRRP